MTTYIATTMTGVVHLKLMSMAAESMRTLGNYLTEVILENGATDSDTLTPGESGRVFLGQFVFDRDESDVGETFQACVTVQDSGLTNCNSGVNHEKNAPEEITVKFKMTMDLVGTEYNPSDRDIAISNEPDFDNEQEAQCNMRGDNNRCEINQDNDASSTLKDIGNAIGKLFNNND